MYKISVNLRTIAVLLFFIVISVLFAEKEETVKENQMTEELKFSVTEFHQKFAIDLNNYVWSILGKEEKTQREQELMVHAAHASRLHWGFVGTAVNLQRGEWLISRVYSVLNRPQVALIHAQICLQLTEDNDLRGFDLAYAYEAVARAQAVTGNKGEFEKYLKLAQEAGSLIEKEDDKGLFFSDLNSEPWYGMKQR